ncbi:hypothetical protein XELAEV_18013242mg [Xenopus laevis]|uniref:Uncharacterized protein n=1 Tax=Xenopus laevis TaxID=8355 RepID=A0A974HZ81_XENLA|nr:hypothetical protein XELAEV_18013242mg [Xenopus laevis]
MWAGQAWYLCSAEVAGAVYGRWPWERWVVLVSKGAVPVRTEFGKWVELRAGEMEWGRCRSKMAARRFAVPLAGKRGAVNLADTDCFVFSQQECDKMSSSMREPAVAPGVPTGDESSDSEGEHEGPQKLIRKVSTSGQLRSKVRHVTHNALLYTLQFLCPQALLPSRAADNRCAAVLLLLALPVATIIGFCYYHCLLLFLLQMGSGLGRTLVPICIGSS